MGRCPVVCGQLPAEPPFEKGTLHPAKLYLLSEKGTLQGCEMCLHLCNVATLKSFTLVFFGKLPVPLTAFLNRLDIQCFLCFIQHTLRNTLSPVLSCTKVLSAGIYPLNRYSRIKIFCHVRISFLVGIPLSKIVYRNIIMTEPT